jgi:hypothetical protein
MNSIHGKSNSKNAITLKNLIFKIKSMPYKFNFDLSTVSKSFFQELAKIASEKNIPRRIGAKARYLAEKFKIREITGLEVSDVITLVEDLVDVYARNLSERKKFLKTKKRALFLPHCSRKYMDKQCQADFDPKIPSYYCNQCSSDCLINQATSLGKKMGYDVYVLPGSSCILRILDKNFYEGIIGVACSTELKLGGDYIKSKGLTGQAIPLIKNGCADTSFNIETLKRVL